MQHRTSFFVYIRPKSLLLLSGKDSKYKIQYAVSSSNSIRRSLKTAMISDVVNNASAYFQLYLSDFSDQVNIILELCDKEMRWFH